MKDLVTRQGEFIGQLYEDHVHGPGVTVYRNSRGYACGVTRDGESFIITGNHLLYLKHVLANPIQYFMGGNK